MTCGGAQPDRRLGTMGAGWQDVYVITRMWEVKARPERVAALLDWVWAELSRLETIQGHEATQVYRSEDRVVVITSWSRDPSELPEPPEDLVERAPHAWDFTPVPRP